MNSSRIAVFWAVEFQPPTPRPCGVGQRSRLGFRVRRTMNCAYDALRAGSATGLPGIWRPNGSLAGFTVRCIGLHQAGGAQGRGRSVTAALAPETHGPRPGRRPEAGPLALEIRGDRAALGRRSRPPFARTPPDGPRCRPCARSPGRARSTSAPARRRRTPARARPRHPGPAPRR